MIQGIQLATNYPLASPEVSPAAVSFSYLRLAHLFQVRYKGLKRELFLSNEQNKTTDIALHQLDTGCNQLQIAIASYEYLRYFKSDLNGSKVNIPLLNESTGTKGIDSSKLATTQQLGVICCSQLELELATVISTQLFQV